MSIPIGGTCVGWFGTDRITEIDEIRKLTTARHEPIYTETLHKNLSLKKQLIINFDSYNDGDRGWKSETTFRDLIEKTIKETFEAGKRYGLSEYSVKKLVTITGDNEADEIYSIPEYCNWQRIMIDQVKGRLDIGLGNFNGVKLDAYEYICSNVSGFKYMDIHMQKDFEDANKTATNINLLKKIADKYRKILRVTEAMPTDIDLWTSRGYDLLVYQLDKAIEHKAQAFCCFIRYDRDGDYRKLAFLRGSETHSKWQEFCGKIIANKPNIILEEDNMLLEPFYYRMKVTYNRDTKKAGIKFIQTVVGTKADGIWGDETDRLVKKYQELNDLAQDGIVGPLTFREMMKTNPQAYIDLQYFTATGEW